MMGGPTSDNRENWGAHTPGWTPRTLARWDADGEHGWNLANEAKVEGTEMDEGWGDLPIVEGQEGADADDEKENQE